MREYNIIADSSFYLFFIDDTDCFDYLEKILKKFEAQISPTIYEEIARSPNFYLIEKIENRINFFSEIDLRISEILRPFFSEEELKKGEQEVIALAYICHNLKLNFVLVIDDRSPVRFIEKNLKCIYNYLTGTANFIRDCYLKYHIFEKEESINLLNEMSKSKFFINKKIILLIKKKLNNKNE